MLLMITVDDLPAEGLPYIIEKTIERGAKNIHVLNAITKKGRMEHIFLVDVEKKYLEEVSLLLALELGTLGMKTFNTEHIMLPFDIVSKNVTVKTKSKIINQIVHSKIPEKQRQSSHIIKGRIRRHQNSGNVSEI